MITLSEKRAKAGRAGGLSTLAKYGSDHFRKIGQRGAQVTWDRYTLLPAGLSQMAMVHRQTREVVAFLSGKPWND